MDPGVFIKQELSRHRYELGLDRPPFHPEDLKSSLRVAKIVRRPLDSSGYAISASAGFVIVINAWHPPVRQRFTLAHEMAHILLAEAKMNSDEKLCNSVAAEILMPESVFRSCAEAMQPCPESAIDLARTFQVSLSAAIRRLAEIQVWRVVFVWWRPYALDGHRRALRVAGFAKPTACRAYIPMGDSVRASSAIGEAFVSGEPVEAVEGLDLGGLRGDYCVRAMRLADGRVLSTIELDMSRLSEEQKMYSREYFQLALWRGRQLSPGELFAEPRRH